MTATTEMIDIMYAHSVGKEIEYKHKATHGWEECKLPLWNWTNFEYRVKRVDKYREENKEAIFKILEAKSWYANSYSIAEMLANNGCRVLANDERIVKPLTDEQKVVLHRNHDGSFKSMHEWNHLINAVQRELKVID